MNFLYVTLIGIGLLWLHFYWRVTASTTTREDRFNQKATVAFIIHLVVSYFGLEYPPVNHGSNFIIGLTPLVLCFSVISSLLMSLLAIRVIRRETRLTRTNLRVLAPAMFIWFAVFNSGWIFLFNGLFDFHNPEVHSASFLKKEFKKGAYKVPPSYIVFIENWTNHHDEVRLPLKQDLYKRITVGDQIEVTTRPGALGIEWLEKVELVTKSNQ